MAKSMHVWKLAHVDAQRETFAFKMAERYHRQVLLAKAWRAWRATIQSKWRDRVEKACQAKAQQVCKAVSTDYETKLARVNEQLRQSRHEVQTLMNKQSRYEEDMKKAFMRGVCALNLEAMSMFRMDEGGAVTGPDAAAAAAAAGVGPNPSGPHVSFPPESVAAKGPVQAPPRGPVSHPLSSSVANTSVELAFNPDGSMVHGVGTKSTGAGTGPLNTTSGSVVDPEAAPRATGAPARAAAPTTMRTGRGPSAGAKKVARGKGKSVPGTGAPLVQRHDPALTRINGARPARISQIVD